MRLVRKVISCRLKVEDIGSGQNMPARPRIEEVKGASVSDTLLSRLESNLKFRGEQL